MNRRYIRIVAVPPGEAPEEIRRAWVGVRIPLPLLQRSAHNWRAAGVLTGPKGFFERIRALFTGRVERKPGYAVSVAEAIAALEAVHPEAARWWRQNAPHLFQRGRAFVFAAEVCREEPDGSAT